MDDKEVLELGGWRDIVPEDLSHTSVFWALNSHHLVQSKNLQVGSLDFGLSLTVPQETSRWELLQICESESSHCELSWCGVENTETQEEGEKDTRIQRENQGPPRWTTAENEETGLGSQEQSRRVGEASLYHFSAPCFSNFKN